MTLAVSAASRSMTLSVISMTRRSGVMPLVVRASSIMETRLRIVELVGGEIDRDVGARVCSPRWRPHDLAAATASRSAKRPTPR